ERWHTLATKFHGEMTTHVNLIELFARGIPDLEIDLGNLHEVAVVDDDNFPIGGLLYVQLDLIGVVLDGSTKRGQGVFRRDCRSAAGGDPEDLVFQSHV